MVRIAIVEDETESCETLRGYLDQYRRERGCEMKVSAFSDGADIADDYRPEYDIIFMDIQMAGLDGMTAAERIRAADPEVILIFITQLAQFAIRGYAVEALDYLLKPVSYYAFAQRLDRAMGRIRKKAARYLMLQVKGGVRKVNISDIRFIESRGHTMLVHMKDEVQESSATMADLETALREYDFCRANKGYLINLAYVDGVRDGCAVVGEDHLLISRGRKNSFMAELTDYIGRQTG